MNTLYSFEAESSVIGGLLLDPETAFDRIADLSKHHFYDSRFAQIFQAALTLRQQNKAVDLVTVFDALGQSDGLMPFLIDCAQNTPSAANIRHHAKIVMKYAKARNAVLQAHEFIKKAQDRSENHDIDGLIGELASGLDGLAVDKADANKTLNMFELMKMAIEEVDARHLAGNEFRGLKTGFASLDNKLMGLQGGNVYVVAGRPAMGKTTAAANIALNVWKENDNRSILFFNLEMSEQQLALRTLSALSDVHLSKLQKGQLNPFDYECFQAALNQINNSKFFINAASDLTIGKMRAIARQTKHRDGLDLVVIDYLSLIDEPNLKFANDNARITYISRQVKMMAKDLDVPIILLAQLNRNVESRNDKRPTLADLRDSGSIEQDADAVIFCYRDGYYNENQGDDLFEFIVAKQRMGETGTAFARWKGECNRLLDVNDGYILERMHARELGRGVKHGKRGI